MSKRKERTIITKRDIVIPAGTVMGRAPWKTERSGPHWDHHIGFGPDATGTFTIDEDVVALNPDLFEVQD